MSNRFDSNLYLDYMLKTKGNFEIISYPHQSCPNTHPVQLGYLDNYSNGVLNFCGKVCNN